MPTISGLLGDISSWAKQTYANGEPYRATLGGLLYGDTKPLMGLLNQPVKMNPMTVDEATAMAMDWGPMALGKIVYHGSPHKFDAFDMSKLGAGKGMQTYGRGLYFAESPDVASAYSKARRSADAGNLYKVDLPDESISKMINWEDEVPEQVRAPISKALMDKFGSGVSPSTGERLYKEVVDGFKFAKHPDPEGAAIEFLKGQGIPGIKYPERGAGKGTFNYVVFDDKLPKIIDRSSK